MDPQDSTSSNEPLDRATARRLSQLRAMPVDLSSISAKIQAEIPRQERRPGLSTSIFALPSRWRSPMRAVAASLLLLATVALVLVFTAARPALASADVLEQIHQQVIADTSHQTPVNSIAEANAVLRRQAPSNPAVPDIQGQTVQKCCVHALGGKMLSCVVLHVDGQPVTVAVARAKDIQCPVCQTMTEGDDAFCTQCSGQTNMVMFVTGDQWTCLMGNLPTARLIELAKSMK